MKAGDIGLQAWRARSAGAWILPGDRVLDLGCHQGEFLHRMQGSIGPSVGIDPLATPKETERYKILQKSFFDVLDFADQTFDAVVCLAVIEHIQQREALISEFRRVLAPRGRVILTAPSPVADYLIALLVRLRVLDGMSLEQHDGFDPSTLGPLFEMNGFVLRRWQTFQFGCNNLMVYEKAGL